MTLGRTLLPRRPRWQARLLSLKYQPQTPAVFLHLDPGYHLIHQLTISVFLLTCAVLQTLMLPLLLTAFSGELDTKNIFHPFLLDLSHGNSSVLCAFYPCQVYIPILWQLSTCNDQSPCTSSTWHGGLTPKIILCFWLCCLSTATSRNSHKVRIEGYVSVLRYWFFWLVKWLSYNLTLQHIVQHVWFYNVFALLL